MSKHKQRHHAAESSHPAWTAADFAQARPAREVLPTLLSAERAQSLLKPRGRPAAASPKVRVGIRLSPQVLAHFKAGGSGWQTRIEAALQAFIEAQARQR